MVVHTHGLPRAGGQYTLTCTVSDDGASVSTYRWFQNGTEVIGERESRLHFDDLGENNSGFYTCEATVGSTNITSPEPWPLRVESKTCIAGDQILKPRFITCSVGRCKASWGIYVA